MFLSDLCVAPIYANTYPAHPAQCMSLKSDGIGATSKAARFYFRLWIVIPSKTDFILFIYLFISIQILFVLTNFINNLYTNI